MHRTTKRERSDDEARRTRSRLSQQDGGCLAASCSKTRLPGEILALPHVVTAIKQFLMTPEKAIIEAARLGQEERLNQLLTKYVCRVPYALVAAAAHGHLNCVELLLKKYFDHTRVNLSFDEWNLVQKAAKDAGGNGHLCVLKCLLSGFYAVSPGVTPMYMRYLASPAAFDALDAAAVNGHLDVVRYIVPHVKDKKYVHGTKAAGILAHAISAGHMDIVEYLFGQDSSWWDLAEAFIAAVRVEQHTFVDRIFEAYRREDKEAFLVEVAGHDGNLQAVKYLYYNGQNNSELISDAFVSAANYSHIATMEFLYDTKRVSRGAFDEAMMDVATYSWVEEAMAFLCSKRCASRRAVNSAFMPTRSFSMVKNLYETYRDSKQAIIGAFKNAGHIDGFYDKTRARIVELLYEEVCLSPEVIGEALVVAARHGRIEVVELLLDDPRIRAGAICDAFVEAAGQKSNELMIFLCSEEQISADTIWSAFLKAVYSDQLGNAQWIVDRFNTSGTVPRKLKHEILMSAMSDGRQNVLQLVGKINFGCCTRSMRKEMLEVARTDAAKKFGQDIL